MFLLFFLISLPLLGQVIDEGFESGDFSGYDWQLSGDALFFVTSSYPYAGSYCAQGGDVNDNQSTTIAIDIDCPQNGFLTFTWKVSSEANYDFLRFYLDDLQMAQIHGTVGWTQVGYELAAGVHNLRWSYEKDYSVSTGSDTGWLDNIIFFIEEEVFNYDLEVLDLTGPSQLTGGESYNYEVTVRNSGQFNLTGYTVSLVDSAGTEFDAQTIFWMLAPGNENTVELTIEPAEDYPDTLIGLFGKCYVSTDENPANDLSQRQDIHIIPSDYQFAVIGERDSLTNQLPVSLIWNTSISETLYFADEIPATGVISSIDFFNNFCEEANDISLRIWLGETDAVSLQDNWINADTLQLVFDNTCDFPSGTNIINIELDSLFVYNGSNLVVLLERVFDGTQYYSWQTSFYFSEITGEEYGRTRYNFSDNHAFDVYDLEGGILCDWLANTVLTISPLPYGSLSGYVFDETGIPLIGAEVTVDSLLWQTVTDSSGYFMLEQIDNGTHQLTVCLEGYADYIQEIEITSGNLTEVEIILVPASSGDENMITVSPVSFGKIYPNPFMPVNSRQGVSIEVFATNSELTIYDIKGRRVKTLFVERSGQVFWDGFDFQGKTVASGIYLLRLQSDEGSANTRLMLVK